MKKRRKKQAAGSSNDKPSNFLAKIRISTKSKSLLDIQTDDHADAGISRRQASKSADIVQAQDAAFSQSEVDRIWKNLHNEKISLEYACIGYSIDNRAVLDYNLMIDMLINYGFSINDIMQFMDEFEDSIIDDSEAPIVMISQKYSSIMTDIEPLKKN